MRGSGSAGSTPVATPVGAPPEPLAVPEIAPGLTVGGGSGGSAVGIVDGGSSGAGFSVCVGAPALRLGAVADALARRRRARRGRTGRARAASCRVRAEERRERIAERDRRDGDDHEDVNRHREDDRAPRSFSALARSSSERFMRPPRRSMPARLPARRAASAIRSGDVTNEMRKNPSPPAPNAEPRHDDHSFLLQ